MSKTLDMEVERIRKIKNKSEKEKIDTESLRELPSPPFSPGHFQGTSPTGRLDLSVSPQYYKPFFLCVTLLLLTSSSSLPKAKLLHNSKAQPS